MFFEIQVPSGPSNLYNQQPLTIQSVIDRVPPLGLYLHPFPLCLPLFTAPSGGSFSGVNLVEAKHDPTGGGFPEPVGGIAEVVGGADAPLSPTSGSGTSTATYAALAGGIAAVVLAIGAGGWYARRRWVR